MKTLPQENPLYGKYQNQLYIIIYNIQYTIHLYIKLMYMPIYTYVHWVLFLAT